MSILMIIFGTMAFMGAIMGVINFIDNLNMNIAARKMQDIFNSEIERVNKIIEIVSEKEENNK